MEAKVNSQAILLDNHADQQALRTFPSPYTSRTAPRATESWDLSWLLGVVKRRKLVIAGVAVATTVLSAALILLKDSLTPPAYEGSFQLLVEPVTVEDQLARSFVLAQRQGTELPGFNVQESGLDYETQIRVLLSPTVLEPVIQDIQARYPDVTYENLTRNLLINRVIVEKEDTEENTRLLQVTYTDNDTEKVSFILDKLAEAYLKYSLEVRRTSISQAVKFIDDQLPRLQQEVNELQGNLQQFRQQYNLIDPELQSENLSEQANALEQERLTNQAQLAEARSRYLTLQQQLASANSVSVLGEAPYYDTLLSQYQDVEGQLAVESARLSEQNPSLQALRERSENISSLMRNEAQKVLSRAADEIAALEARNQAIISSKNQLNQELQRLPAVTRQFSDLQRELGVSSDILNEFLNRREALRIDAAQRETPWEMVTPPSLAKNDNGEPVNVQEINKKLYLALAMILGSFLGLGVGFLLEILQDTPHSASEIKRLTGILVLGDVPIRDRADSSAMLPFARGLLPGQKPKQLSPAYGGEIGNNSVGNQGYYLPNSGSGVDSLGFVGYKTSPFEESFRSLYTNIQSLNLDEPVQSVVVSSALPGEGKSTVSANLAQAASALGKRVLVIDADLRHPQLHNYLGIVNSRGLSDLLSDENLDLEDVIQQSPVDPNLSVLTAGQPSPDPTRILASERMTDVTKRLQETYDFIIYDMPPVLGLADAILVAPRVDGVLMVVRLGKTNRTSIMQALDSLKVSKASVLGTIANGSTESATSVYSYYS